MKTQKKSRRNQSPAPEQSSKSQTSITDLPEAILLYIISFLPTVAAVRTSAVTPPWRNLWRSLPTLDCDMVHFVKRQRSYRESLRSRRLFVEFVTEALRRRPRHIPIRRFILKFMEYYRNHDQLPANVDTWIRTVADMGAVDLDLDFSFQGKKNQYKFRFSDIASSSIEVLKLKHCIFSVPRKELCLYLHSIKELYLEPSSGNAGEIELLIASCVNLESFKLVVESDCYYHGLSIVSGSLRHLALFGRSESRHSSSVEICTPRLESITLSGHCLGMYTLKDVSSMVEATVEIHTFCWWEFACWTTVVSSLTGVERLTIHNLYLGGEVLTREDVREWIEEREGFRDVSKLKFAEEVFSEAFRFHNIKYLKLKTRYSEAAIRSLESFLKKCPRVETLVLVGGYTRSDFKEADIGDSTVALQIPCLREVTLERYKGTKNEVFVVDMLKKHGVVLEKIVAFPARVGLVLPPPFLL